MSVLEFSLTIEAPELADALNNLAAALRRHATITTTNINTQDTEADAALSKAAQKVKDAAAKKVVPIVELPADCEPKEQPEAEPAAVTQTEYTLEDVRAALMGLSKAKGKEAAKDILNRLGVKSVSNLQPEQIAEAMRMVEEA